MATLALFPKPKAVIFDLMGTCTDWHSSILPSLIAAPPLASLPASALPAFAAEWRAEFFKEIHRRFHAGEGNEDIDVTHRRMLDAMLRRRGADDSGTAWGEEVKEGLVQSWHRQKAWPDSVKGIERLKEKFFAIVLANGTTRLQLDIVQSSKLPFHSLFSSQLLGLTKPDPKIYLKALELLDVRPAEAVMVAAHAYDLRAAAKVGMRTIYIHRQTEDLDEDMGVLATEFDSFVDGRAGGVEVGLGEVARILEA